MKKGAKSATTLGRKRFQLPSSGYIFLSYITRSFFLYPSGFLLSRGTLDRSGRLPASQSGVRISLRGSNESAEGLLDGSSSDNSQARRGCLLYTERETERRRNEERKEDRSGKSLG